MAEGFGPYHVPQQSRRDKLRILTQNQLDPSSVHACSGYLPLYGSSLLPPDLLTSAASPPSSSKSNAVKEECPFFTGFPYLDPTPPPGFQFTNASSNNNNSPNLSPNPFLYPLREFDIYGQGADQAVLFKPQPVTLAYRQDQSRLSLSLSSHHQGGSSSPSDQLNLPRFGSNVYATPAFVSASGSSSVSNEVSRSSVPLGPFTGYASVLKGSRFLKPAQQLLQDFCDVGRVMICPEKLNLGSDSSSGLMDSPMENWGECIADADLPPESRRKKSTLLSMLEEVYKRYKQYYQQMQAVVASFECVVGLGNAAPFANLALKFITKYFKSLKNAITAQLSEKPHHDLINQARGGGFVRHGSGADQGLPCRRSFHEHQSVWRPQRGLPERAVTVLRAWLFEHFLHPYPTDTDKLMLAKQTGLSRNQVSNWFINARVRLWKPMVEEIHMLETKQAHKSLRNDQNQDFNRSVYPSSSASSLGSENPSTSTQRVQDMPSKRCRSELPDLPESQLQPVNTPPYNGSISLSSPDQQVVSMSRSSTGAVSLTLGLHQNNNRAGGFSEPLAISAAQRFGLGLEAAGSEDEYVMNGFEPQNRHFGGAQFLHDFVG